jgi:hypothetical protein
MTRKIRNTAILAKIETTYGVDAVPTGATDAILISEATFNLAYNNVDRNNIKGYMGGDEQLAGTRYVEMSFGVEISGSGAAGTAPAWGKLLRACSFAETITAASRVEYNPISTALDAITFYHHDDGVLHKALGCMGTVQLAMGEGERPMLRFTFTGLDGGLATAANPTQTFAAWKAPQVITDANTGDIKLGSAYSAGAITGGTAYPSRGLSLDVANQVAKISLLGGQSVDITNRAVIGSMQLELDAAEEVAMFADVNANTLTTMSFEHGTTAGAKVLFHMPSVQRINPKHADYEGRVQIMFDLRVLPLDGNDELVIVAA